MFAISQKGSSLLLNLVDGHRTHSLIKVYYSMSKQAALFFLKHFICFFKYLLRRNTF